MKSALLACLLALPLLNARSDELTFLVKPYVQLPATDGMTIMWETSAPVLGSVEYGPTRDLGKTLADQRPVALHELRLTGLKTATKYYYRVRCGELVSEIWSFRTAPAPGTDHWRMALYGDSRSFPATHQKVAEQIAKGNVDLILHTGDIVLDGRQHERWRKEFFEPLGDLARGTPWVSTIGNHERDSENYFSYMALPGNKHYFAFDYANAHLICLDSNDWIQKGRDSKQYEWLVEELKKPRTAKWTFVAFHHPLFSAHATRPINPLRWDWAPVLLDPASRVDAVLAGHDHFYARNYRMGLASDRPQAGVLCMTSAGGGANLYPTKPRDYIAYEKEAHHYTHFEFDGDRVVLRAIDLTGKEIDHYELTKDATPADQFCAYEVEEFREALRHTLSVASPLRLRDKGTTALETTLRVPLHFTISVRGTAQWEQVPGWKFSKPSTEFMVEAGKFLTIPIQAEVAAGAFDRNPSLTITFEGGKFRNRTVILPPLRLAGPERIEALRTEQVVTVDGRLAEECWKAASVHALLGIPSYGGRRDQVQVVANAEWVHIGARLDHAGTNEKFLVVLRSGTQTHTFTVDPTGARTTFASDKKDLSDDAWQAAAVDGKTTWTAELAVPRRLFEDWSDVRVNFIHRLTQEKETREYHLNPACTMGTDPDRIADWKPVPLDEKATRLELK